MVKTSRLCDLLSSMPRKLGSAGVRFALGLRRTRRSDAGVHSSSVGAEFRATVQSAAARNHRGENAWPKSESNRNVEAWPGSGSCWCWSSPAASSTTSFITD